MTTRLFRARKKLLQERFGRGRRKRRQILVAKIEESGLFDREWYLNAYTDVRDSGVDPLRHYLDSGWREGRDPGPSFCTTAYLKAYSDVAALRVNPLVHYVEHGRVEGRGALHPGGPLRAVADPLEKFGPAAPCAQFPLPPGRLSAWSRAGRIRSDAGSVIEVGGTTIAKGDRAERAMVDRAMARLAALSGSAADLPEALTTDGRCLEIRDAWHAGEGVFRTRWRQNGPQPLVVRALQHVGVEAVLVGEACIDSDLDLLDLRLVNPFFPLLFLFTDPAGEILGVAHLTFPSLCRGGLHYPELVALMEGGAFVSPSAVDDRLSSALLALRQGKARPLVDDIIVDVTSGTGTHPLFQREFQAWLTRVVRVPVRAGRSADDAAGEYLASAVEPKEQPAIRSGQATLRLLGDMVPAISALTASAESGTHSDELAGSLIDSDGSLVSTYVRIANGTRAAHFGSSRTALPTLTQKHQGEGVRAGVPLLAIRMRRRVEPHEAELLAPVVPSSPPAAGDVQSISWLIWPEAWKEADLHQGLESLSLQKGMVSSIVFIGEPTLVTRAKAGALFGGRVRTAADAGSAPSLINDPLCGYLGPATVLHDRHSVSRLAELLHNDDVLTASALLAFAERRGKGALVLPSDPDSLRGARVLAGAVVPLDAPPPHLWVGRTDAVLRTLSEEDGVAGHGRHVCDTSVSVSTLDPGSDVDQPLAFPPAEQGRAFTTELLIG